MGFADLASLTKKRYMSHLLVNLDMMQCRELPDAVGQTKEASG